MRILMCGALALAVPSFAFGFCGHYAGKAGQEVFNKSSAVAYARVDDTTTLTLSNDFHGDAEAFAMVIPVPEVLGPDDVQTVHPDLLRRLDDYSSPRLVRYDEDETAASGCMVQPLTLQDGATIELPNLDTIDIESSFEAGEYDLVVLSADESDDLVGWLGDNGYEVSPDAEEMLQEYIDAGSYFLAAKVDTARIPAGQHWLSPLQISYRSEAMSLPVRLGTLSSGGSQDLLLYGITSVDDGQLGIANYPEAALEDECMRPATAEYEGSFGSWYERRFASAVEQDDRASWLVEYSWSPSKCDPCSTDPLTDEELAAFGFDKGSAQAHFTRLHLRFAPEAIDQDLMLYGSGSTANDQVRYIAYDASLDESYAVCEALVMPAGCSVPTMPLQSGMPLLAGLLLWWRRRE